MRLSASKKCAHYGERIPQSNQVCLLLHPNNDTEKPLEIRLTDFGFAKQARSMEDDKNLKTIVYTPYYISPEVVDKIEADSSSSTNKPRMDKATGLSTYDEACDIWALGVTLYLMLLKRVPFNSLTGQNNCITPNMKNKIQTGDFRTNSDYEKLSSNARDLIEKMLVVDANLRIKTEAVLKHPFLVYGKGEHVSFEDQPSAVTVNDGSDGDERIDFEEQCSLIEQAPDLRQWFNDALRQNRETGEIKISNIFEGEKLPTRKAKPKKINK